MQRLYRFCMLRAVRFVSGLFWAVSIDTVHHSDWDLTIPWSIQRPPNHHRTYEAHTTEFYPRQMKPDTAKAPEGERLRGNSGHEHSNRMR